MPGETGTGKQIILGSPQKTFVVEIQTTRFERPEGMKTFLEIYPDAIPVFIGTGGIPFEEFFSNDPVELLK